VNGGTPLIVAAGPVGMPKAGRKSSAVEVRRARVGGVDLAGAFGLLATTLARARELPGRMADAIELAARLEALRDDLTVCLARARCEMATAGRLGRDFSARRAAGTAHALDEELGDAEAMLGEVMRVMQRLRREARALDHRLAMCASLVVELPPCPERDQALELVERTRASLAAPPRASSTVDVLYTFTRGELKQTGHAR
jgi:hypothetical protein